MTCGLESVCKNSFIITDFFIRLAPTHGVCTTRLSQINADIQICHLQSVMHHLQRKADTKVEKD